MCGIAGRILTSPGKVGNDLVELMDAQEHRGADSTGFAVYGPPRYLEGYEKLGTSLGDCHHCHTGMCPVGIATQDPELEKRMDPHAGAERVARYLTAMTMEITALAKACGKSSVHNLEVEDLRAMSFEASAFTGVMMAGIDSPFEW